MPSSMDDKPFGEAGSPQKGTAGSVVTVTEETNAVPDFRAEAHTERGEPSRDADFGHGTSTDDMEVVADAAGGEMLPVMSKNAMKRAKRAERLATVKLERRARERAAKKEKKRERAGKRSAGDLDEADDQQGTQRLAKKPKLDFGGTVVVDLGFDNLMSEKEITSLCSQLAYTYSCNRRASFPFSLLYTSLNGQTHERLETLGDASYKRWSHTKWFAEDYESLWHTHPSPLDLSEHTTSIVEPGLPINTDTQLIDGLPPAATLSVALNTQDLHRTSPKTSFVYLTADTEDELTELSPNETYIIGGICDHNRYKNLCLNKARESGIRTARLPIGRYLASLQTRKVLTVNQVFEILVKWVETKDWEEALYSIIPKRKFQQGAKDEDTKVVNAADVEGAFGEEVAPSEH